MSLKRMCAFLLLAALCAGFVFPSTLHAGNGSSPEIETILPESTLFYMTVKDMDALREGIQNTAFWDILQEDEVKALCGEISTFVDGLVQKEVDEDGKRGFAMIAKAWNTLVAPVHGQITFAVLYDPANYESSDAAAPSFQIALIANVGQDTETYKTNFKSFMVEAAKIDDPEADPWSWFSEGVEKDGSTLSQEEYKGSTLYKVSNPEAQVSVAFGFHRDSILFTFGYASHAPAKALIDRMETSSDTSLAASEKYKRMNSRLKTGAGSVAFYVDMEGIGKRYLSKVPDEAKGVIDALGLHAFKTLGCSCTPTGKVFRKRFFLEMSAERKGLAAMLSPASSPLKTPALVPADCMAYGTWRMNPPALFEELKSYLKTARPDAYERYLTTLNAAKGVVGADLEEGLINNFNGEFGYYIKKTNAGMIPVPQLYLFAEIKDAEKFQGVILPALEILKQHASGGVTVAEQTFKDVTFHSVSAPLPIPIDFNPSWTVKDGFLWIALSANDMKLFINDMQKEGVKFSGSEIAQKVYEGMPKENRVGQSYSDVPRRFEEGYASVKSVISMVQGMIAMGAGKGFDLSKLPLAETISQHLFPTGSVVTVDAEGLYSEGDTFGVVSVTAPAIGAVVAAIAIPNLLESKKLSNERTVAATLKQLNTAQAIFKEKVSKDTDRDNDGEYASDFLELTGDNSAGTLEPHVIGVSQINMVPADGDATVSEKNGYYFKIYTSKNTDVESADDDEVQFVVAAWPVKCGKTGDAVFVITEDGMIYRYRNAEGLFNGKENIVTMDDIFGTYFDNTTIGQGAVEFVPAR